LYADFVGSAGLGTDIAGVAGIVDSGIETLGKERQVRGRHLLFYGRMMLKARGDNEVEGRG